MSGETEVEAREESKEKKRSKRKRWGTAPAEELSAPVRVSEPNPITAMSSVAELLAAEAEKRRRGDQPKASKKVMIPSDRNPGYNYVGLLIGPGGSKQKALQAEAGGNVKIMIRGKGTGDSFGGSDEPLHVLLEGDSDCVDKAEHLVRELLDDSEKADAEKGRQLASLGLAPTASSDDKPKSAYSPKPVAELLGITPTASSGGAVGLGLREGQSEELHENVGVPNGVVGYIIGRGGESITSMQRSTGCRVQIQKEHEMDPGSSTRIITLSAPDKVSIDQCRAIIEGMVAERTQQSQRQGHFGGMSSTTATGEEKLQQALAAGEQLVSVQVPDGDVGLVIGKGGMNIRNIQDRTGANIQIPPTADPHNPLIRTCSITHQTLVGANMAREMVEELLKERFGSQADTTIQISIPDKDVGMVIGRSGCVIRELQTKTKCKIQIPSQASPGQPNRIVTVSGSPDGCQQVKQMMERIIIDQSSQSVMSGAGFNQQNFQHGGQPHGMFQGVTMNQYGQPQGAYGQQYGHQHPNYGQQQQYGSAYAGQQANAYGQAAGHAGQQKTDYSAEWAAYYAAQAAAQQPTTSSSVTSQAPAPAASSSGADASQQSQAVPTDPTAYYDDFWRYVSYYGEEAARTYYGAWSPSVGTPNPNDGRGSTMNASQSQATTDLGTTTQGSGNISSPGQSQAARDTSVRNVSNLPAWMTKGQS